MTSVIEVAILDRLGVIPPEMTRTDRRWRDAIGEMTRGYDDNPEEILTSRFEAGSYDELVLVRDVDFVSLCEHHLFPFAGRAHVGYIPRGHVVGLSKLARLVDCYAHRFQLQERMTVEIAEAIEEHVKPRGTIVVLEATHGCLAHRGALKQSAKMVTSCLRGVFETEASARAEALGLIGR